MKMTLRTSRLEPAYSLIRKFDRPDAKERGEMVLARYLDVDPSTIRRWHLAKSKGGRDGYVPRWYYEPILQLAEETNVPLSPSEFVVAAGEPATAA